MKIYATLNPDYISNIYLVADDENKFGIIINPGSFAYNVYKLVQSAGVEIKGIIVTQNAKECTDGIRLIKKIYDAKIYAYSPDIEDFKTVKVRDGFIIEESGITLKVLETPVNTFDSISIMSQDVVFVGNIMEAGTLSGFEEKDTPSDYEYQIIKNKILNINDNLIIYPGKGPATTLEIEKKFNPYFKEIMGINNVG